MVAGGLFRNFQFDIIAGGPVGVGCAFRLALRGACAREDEAAHFS
jgi:hypothetical protein